MVSGALSLPSRGAFHLSLTVLSAIGHQGVFSLGRWSALLPTRFLVSSGTPDTGRLIQSFVYRTITFFGPSFQLCSTRLSQRFAGPLPRMYFYTRFGLFPFRSPLLRKSILFLFLRLLRCFSSPSSLITAYVFSSVSRGFTRAGFPHSDIYGSLPVCGSP
jgi:hypothetical protein